ncbi:MAG: ORF6N domain-containing protein [Candidatus Omnitrophota bacterium]
MREMILQENIESRILQIRGRKVMLDRDIADLYGVSTKALNQAVRRNSMRFPKDFMLILTSAEQKELVTNCDRFAVLKHSTHLPHAFTEQGVAMLSSVLNSERAVMVNIQIMRAFVNLRRVALTYAGLKRKIDDMEKKYDAQFSMVFEAMRQLIIPPSEMPKRRIGFHHD